MAEEKIKFKNRYKAEQAVCEAFVNLGILAGINASKGEGPADLDKDLVQACRECYFSDPHFMGGPCIIIRADSLMRIERIFAPAFDVSERLLRYIEKGGNAAKIKKGRASVAVIFTAHAWLKRIVTT